MALTLISLMACANSKTSVDRSLLISRPEVRKQERKSCSDFNLFRKFIIVTSYQTDVSIVSRNAKGASTGIEFALVYQGQQGIHSIERYRLQKSGTYTFPPSLSCLNVSHWKTRR